MASSRDPVGTKSRVVVMLVICFTIFTAKSDGEGTKQVKTVLGSRPPHCENKCLNCRPCVAALVAPPRPKSKNQSKASSSHGDENYYLLTWRCKCGNKLFHP